MKTREFSDTISRIVGNTSIGYRLSARSIWLSLYRKARASRSPESRQDLVFIDVPGTSKGVDADGNNIPRQLVIVQSDSERPPLYETYKFYKKEVNVDFIE